MATRPETAVLVAIVTIFSTWTLLVWRPTLVAAAADEPVIVFFDDVEAGSPSALGLWSAGGDNGTVWGTGPPQNQGPPSAYSPTNAWGTNIAGDYTANVSQLVLISPQINLTGAASATLSFAHWYEVENGSDGGTVLARNVSGPNQEWHLLIPAGGYPAASVVSLNVPGVGIRLPGYSATGASPDWAMANLSLDPFVENLVEIGFVFGSDQGWHAGDLGAGWYLDDIAVSQVSQTGIKLTPDGRKYGDLGETLAYDVIVRNLEPLPDVVDITIASEVAGWTHRVLRGGAPLADTNGNGIPDTGLIPPLSEENLTVEVQVPASLPVGDYELTTLTGVSSNNQSITDSADLWSLVEPHIETAKYADPTTINVSGTGSGEETTIYLTVKGRGVPFPGESRNAADVVFVIDDTASMGAQVFWVKDNMKYIVERLTENITSVRFGLVTYKDKSEIDVDIDLTFDTGAFRTAMGTFQPEGGGDELEDSDWALQVAANLSWCCSGVPKIMVLIGDFPAHNNTQLTHVALWAHTARDIHTNAIAVRANASTIYWFSAAAENGSGVFSLVTSPDQISDAIITGILRHVPPSNVAATDSDITDANPLVRDVLPPHITYLPGTFRDPVTMASRDPDFIGIDAFGNTVLEWNVSLLRVGEAWAVHFNVTSSLAGVVPTNVFSLSQVSYLDWREAPQEVLFPEVYVTVLTTELLPPSHVTTTWDGAQVGLVWDEPVGSAPDHYLIYKAPTDDPRGFANLSPGAEYANVRAPAAAWTDLQPIAPGDEFYYLIRSANVDNTDISGTSNTAGVYAGQLNPGLTVISRPLEYFPWVDYSPPTEWNTVGEFRTGFGANSILYMDVNGRWQEVSSTGLGDPNTILEVGQAYVVDSSAARMFVFVGLPGAMLLYDEYAYAGFDLLDDALSLNATARGNDVILTFTQPAGMVPGADYYAVYFSSTRTGFFDSSAQLVGGGTVPAGIGPMETVVHADALLVSDELYYVVVPYGASQQGASSYSIGVWTRTFQGHETLGLPLLSTEARSIDWYCDAIPNTLGMLFPRDGVWVGHFREMPEGVFDALVVQGVGYQVTVSPSMGRFSFIGW